MSATFAAWIAAWASGAVGIHIQSFAGVSNEEAQRVASSVRALAEAWSDVPRIAIDDLVWSDCTRADLCLGEIRARMQCDTILLLKLQGGPTRIRLAAELHGEAGPPARLIVDVTRTAEAMDKELIPLVTELFSRRKKVELEPKLPVAAEARPSPSASRALWPLVAAGAGAAALAGGVAYGLGSKDAQNRLQSTALTPSEIMDLDDRVHRRALAADVFFGAAAAGLAACALLILLD